MPIAVVASWEGGETSAAGTSFNIPVTGVQVGDLLVVVTAIFGSAGDGSTPMAPTDNASTPNTYTTRSITVNDATFRNSISLADCIVAIAPTNVTLRCATSQWLSGVVLRVTGHDAINYAHQFATGKEQTSSAPVSNALTTTVADVLLVGGLTHDNDTNPTITEPSGWTMQQKEENFLALYDYAVATKVETATGSKSATWALSGSSDCAMILAAYAADPGVAVDQTRPDADVTTTGWTTTPLFSKINDSSDATVIQATAS